LNDSTGSDFIPPPFAAGVPPKLSMRDCGPVVVGRFPLNVVLLAINPVAPTKRRVQWRS